MNQSIKSFMPSPAPAATDHEWVSQLNLTRFEPIGSETKKRMKDLFENQKDIKNLLLINLPNSLDDLKIPSLCKLKERMSLSRFDDATFLRIFCVQIATPKFRQEYNISHSDAAHMYYLAIALKYLFANYSGTFDDVFRICLYYNPHWTIN
ncbi:hypothetical protein DdX_14652 [Ditylenchus destructor]|uniref:Uncharacterized protein n=1 Tax=Ditylenchus destructor TaxID=166010 RepID=A0AAD4MU70_9BILA|nr:hypothetical protein DdX_14652 [Ditylenchus destructor]